MQPDQQHPNPETDKPDSGALVLDKEAACEVCGHYGAFHVGDHTLCPECYQNSGACCGGCGTEDEDSL